MENYLDHLRDVGDNELSFKRKLQYFHYNYGKYIPGQNISVLEIGPGSGAMVSYLNSRKVNNIDIIDNDKYIVTYMKKNFIINHAYATSDLSTLKSKLQKYDLIMLLQVFEHMPRSQSHYKKIIGTLYRSLKKNGKMIILVPNGSNPFNIMERYSDLQHETAYTENSLRELPFYCGIGNYEIALEPYRIPPVHLINVVRIICQRILHVIVRTLIMINGGIYPNILTPCITLVITKKS